MQGRFVRHNMHEDYHEHSSGSPQQMSHGGSTSFESSAIAPVDLQCIYLAAMNESIDKLGTADSDSQDGFREPRSLALYPLPSNCSPVWQIVFFLHRAFRAIYDHHVLPFVV